MGMITKLSELTEGLVVVEVNIYCPPYVQSNPPSCQLHLVELTSKPTHDERGTRCVYVRSLTFDGGGNALIFHPLENKWEEDYQTYHNRDHIYLHDRGIAFSKLKGHKPYNKHRLFTGLEDAKYYSMEMSGVVMETYDDLVKRYDRAIKIVGYHL